MHKSDLFVFGCIARRVKARDFQQSETMLLEALQAVSFAGDYPRKIEGMAEVEEHPKEG